MVSSGRFWVTLVEKRQRRLTRMTTSRTHADGSLLDGSLTRRIIGAFYYVYDRLGFGFLEAVYRRALAHVLMRAGLTVECEQLIEVWFDGVKVGHYRADMLVERRVLVEFKATDRLTATDRKQLLNYLRATDVEVGLLLNFGPRAQFERLVYSNSKKPLRSRE
jgi:GxxExxY protein